MSSPVILDVTKAFEQAIAALVEHRADVWGKP